MKMLMFVVAAAVCACSSVFAGESRTWTGGGTGWGDAASWGGETPPAAGDKAIIPASLTASVADGDVDLVAALGEIEVQTGGTLSLANAGKALALSAKLVGSGALVADGSKGVTLSGDNVDFDGPTSFTNTPVTVTSRHGLGAPTRAVAHTNNRLLFKGEGLTNDVPLEIVGNRNAAATYFTENQTDHLVFNGEFKCPKTIQIHLGDWEFNGGLTFVSSVYVISTSANCHPVIRNKPMKSTSVYMPYSFGDKATLTLAAPTNTYQSFAFAGCAQLRDRGLVCGCTNALRPTTYLALGRGSSFDGTLNLNGYDQTVTYLRYSDYQKYDPGWYCVPSPTTKAYGLVFSDEKPATVTMTGAEKTNANWRVAYKFSGKVSLTKQGVGTYTIVNQYSDTTGKLRVEEGAVVFDWSAGWGGDVEVVGGEVRFLEGSALNVENASAVEVSDGAKLYITNGVSLHCARLKLGDGEKQFGTYSRETDPDYIDGDGEIVVTTSAAELVWTGGAGTGDVTDGDNWEGGVAPTFTGAETLRFSVGDAGLRLTFPSGKSMVNGIGITGSGDVTISGGQVAIGAAGLSIEPTADMTVSIASDVRLEFGTQEWHVGEGATLDVSGDISGGVLSGSLALKGLGTKILSGDNSGLLSQLDQLDGDGAKGKGILYLRSSTALGSPLRYSTLKGNSARFDFTGVMTNETPFYVNGAATSSGFSLKTQDSTLVLKGAFNIPKTSQVPQITLSSTWIFLGGIYADGGNYWFSGGGEVHVREVPIDVHSSTAYFVTGGMTLHLGVSNNVIPNLHVSSTVICEATNVLSATSKLALSSPGSDNTGGIIDLNGYDQDVCATKPYNTTVTEDTAKFGTVKSSTPAVLRITGPAASDTYVPWKFTGQASFEHVASGTFRLLRAVSDSTGSLTVSAGRVELLHGAAWSNATAVNVTGGTLFVSDESATCAFGLAAGASRAAMTVADGGTLDLAAGGAASVKSLSVDGNSLSAGYYGSKTCTDERVPPANRLDCITGGGVLYNRGIGGLLLLVR